MLVYFALIIALGMRFSLTQKTTGKAVGWTLAICLFLVAGIPAIAGMCAVGDAEDLGEAVLACSPVLWVGAGPVWEDCYDELDGEWAAYAIVTAVYAMTALGILLSTARSFDRRVGRQSGVEDSG